MTPQQRRFYGIYALAWLPVVFTYVAFISAVSNWDLGGSLVVAAMNVLPAAAAGLAVVRLCRHLPMPAYTGDSWYRFAAAHFAAMFAYAITWAAGIVLLFTAARSVAAGRFRPWMMSAGELQWQLGAGLLAYTCIAAVSYLVDSLMRAREEVARAERAEALRARAELQALRARFNPHFLFNTLHSLLELISTGDRRAEDAVERAGDLFRYMFDKRADGSGQVLLRQELAFVDDYLSVESLRLGDRLRTCIDVEPAALDALVPPFLLQPLVENAVRHAAATRIIPTTILVRARCDGGALEIDVVDDGPGTVMPLDHVEGSGLWMLRRRLDLHYAGNSRMNILTASGSGFTVQLRLPLRTRRSTIAEPSAAGDAWVT